MKEQSCPTSDRWREHDATVNFDWWVSGPSQRAQHQTKTNIESLLCGHLEELELSMTGKL